VKQLSTKDLRAKVIKDTKEAGAKSLEAYKAYEKYLQEAVAAESLEAYDKYLKAARRMQELVEFILVFDYYNEQEKGDHPILSKDYAVEDHRICIPRDPYRF
jgi:hypothetical protein